MDPQAGGRHAPAAAGSLEAAAERAWEVRAGVTVVDLRNARRRASAWAARAGADEDQFEDLATAVYEAMTNVVEHAYPAGAEGAVVVSARIVRRTLELTVADEGTWAPESADPGFRGRGLLLIHALADESEIRTTDRGTVVAMRWHLRE